jgi:hypothetical protein
MYFSQLETFEDLQTAVDKELWTIAKRRDTPALRKAGNPSATQSGIDALGVTRVVAALLKSSFSPLGYEAVFARDFEEIAAGYAPVWARRFLGQIHLIRLRHDEGRCRGGRDLEKDTLYGAAEVFARELG